MDDYARLCVFLLSAQKCACSSRHMASYTTRTNHVTALQLPGLNSTYVMLFTLCQIFSFPSLLKLISLTFKVHEVKSNFFLTKIYVLKKWQQMEIDWVLITQVFGLKCSVIMVLRWRKVPVEVSKVVTSSAKDWTASLAGYKCVMICWLSEYIEGNRMTPLYCIQCYAVFTI